MAVNKTGVRGMNISVIIPCFNVQDYIEECLHSVYHQSLPPAEVICVDNHSSDRTVAVLKELQKNKYPSLILLQESRSGANYARNTGLYAATSSWIQFLDADDLLLPTKFEWQTGLVREHVNAGLVAAAYFRRKLEGKEKEVGINSKNTWVAPFMNQCGCTCSNLWSRDALLEAGGWNTALKSSQESELMMRMVLLNKPILFDEKPLTIIRERASGQISQTDPGQRHERYLEVRQNYLEQLKAKYPGQYAENKQLLLTYFISNLLILQPYNSRAAGLFAQKINWNDWKPAAGFGMSYLKAVAVKLLGWSVFSSLSRMVSHYSNNRAAKK